MLEALEKLKQRDSLKLSSSQMQPAQIRTIADIRAVLAELDPIKNLDGPEVVLHTVLRGESEDDEGHPIMRTYAVSAPTRSRSRRTILLDGFMVVQKQDEARELMAANVMPISVNGHDMLPPRLIGGGSVFIDPLIRQWLGGERRGLFIYWELQDGYIYKYSIFQHKLSRYPSGETESPDE